jgi:hypothetical protein
MDDAGLLSLESLGKVSHVLRLGPTPPYTPQTSAIAQLLMPLRGFPRKTLIGPIWMKILVEDRDGMKSEFERLLRLDFDQLLSAHGTFVPKNAHAQVEQAFQEMFN